MSFEPPGDCPACGEEVERGAVACPHCGSCADTGWSDETAYDGLDLPSWQEEELPRRKESKVLSGLLTLGLVAALLYVFVFR